MKTLRGIASWFLVLLASALITFDTAVATVAQADWTAYKAAFLDPRGRIVDTGNRNISHSEGQGYGMWLAVLANDMAAFELMWTFTRTELLIRDDGLAAWRWDPRAKPNVTDVNNATDGDLLIAQALALAAKQWRRGDYARAATKIANAILTKTVVKRGTRTILLPAASGFGADERDDGPVVNPSYLIFEAFPVLNELAPSPLWQALGTDGLADIRSFSFGARRLPADWVSLKNRPRPADGFPPEFGYNAVRIPLYLARAKLGDAALYDRLVQGMSIAPGVAATFDLRGGATKDRLSDPGYRLIVALAACAAQGTAIPADLRKFQPTLYYPSTLYLLALSSVTQNYRRCL